MNKLLIVLFLILAGSTGGYFYWSAEGETLPVFRELTVTRGQLLKTISATGTIEPVEVVDVGAQIVGSIKSFGEDPDKPGKTVDFGTHVKQGEVIAQLDDLPYVAAKEQAAADMTLAEAELSRDQSRYDLATKELNRANLLRSTISESEYDEVVASQQTAKAELAIAEARLEQARISLKQAEINLGYTTIRSPIDGIVLDRRVNVGQTVVVGLNTPSLFLLAEDLRRMQVWAAVNEADIGQVYVGQPVTFKVDAYRDEEFIGAVSQIRLNASTAHNVVTYGVIVDIDNTNGKLLPYMTANLQFEVSRRQDVLLVPNQALRWRPTLDEISPSYRSAYGKSQKEPVAGDQRVELDSPTLWIVAEDGLLRPVQVETGLSDGVLTEIVSDELSVDQALAVATIQHKRRDFVSSFVSRVTESPKDK